MADGLAFRYGIEVEGPFKGEMTLILPTAAWHKVSVVEAALRRHPDAQRPTHLWIETQQDERFDWLRVAELIEAGFNVTAQIREPEDVPPVRLLRSVHFGVVWMVPERYRDVLLAAEYIKWAVAPGDGCEAEIQLRKFDPANYEKDQVWQH